MRRAGWQVGAGALKPNMQLQSSHQPQLLSVLVLASYGGVVIMTPPAPALAALLLSGFALFACLGMLAVTMQREIYIEWDQVQMLFLMCSPGTWAGGEPAGGGGEAGRPGG